ncbi:MAG: hypothetical protein WBH47_17620 [Streptosporangiaceae bacterium]
MKSHRRPTADPDAALAGGVMPDNPWLADADLTTAEPSPTGIGAGLVSLGFIKATLRRSAWLWSATAALGLVVGAGWYLARPPAAHAAATVLIPPSTYPGEILDDQAIAQSRTVAAAALKEAGSHESAVSFLRQYAVTTPTDRVLTITTTAKSPATAVRDANAVAAAFLVFQRQLLAVQDRLVTASLQHQISQSQQDVDALSQQLSRLAAEPSSAAQRAQLATLRSSQSQAVDTLAELKLANTENVASMAISTATADQGSRVLDPAAVVPQSRLKGWLSYAVVGLIVGLALGAGIAVIRALTSDRLRRRDDVARVLGAPVTLSVGRLADRPGPESRRIAAHLRRSLPAPARSADLAALAIVAVDSQPAAALSLVSLAADCGQHGLRVIVADLCSGAPAGQLLGACTPGVHRAVAGAVELTVMIPDPDEVAPIGPLDYATPRGWPAPVPDQLAAACGAADVLLTLTSLDPAVGGEHLASWTTAAVVMLTAGRSSAERVHSAGEMIRLAGIAQISAILLAADKTDQSLGVPAVTDEPGVPRQRASSIAGSPEPTPVGGAAASLPQPR